MVRWVDDTWRRPEQLEREMRSAHVAHEAAVRLARVACETSGNHGRIFCQRVRAPIKVKSLGLGRLRPDLSNGMLSDVIGGS